MSQPERTLKVLGQQCAGKKTMMGAMIYMCGLDLKMLGQLQADGINGYDGIMDYYRQNELPLVFAAKNGPVRFTDSSQPDGIIYVLDATSLKNVAQENGQSFTESEKEVFKRTGCLILAVNKMDAVNWSKETYQMATSQMAQQLNALGLPLEKYNHLRVQTTG